jgi:toxin ParE1/3/4
MRAIRLREQARDDLNDAAAYYDEHAAHMTQRFIDAYLAAEAHIAKHPATGSLRYANEDQLRELRFWLVSDFPYAVFYIDRPDFIDIVRVLHQASDIPQNLQH